MLASWLCPSLSLLKPSTDFNVPTALLKPEPALAKPLASSSQSSREFSRPTPALHPAPPADKPALTTSAPSSSRQPESLQNRLVPKPADSAVTSV